VKARALRLGDIVLSADPGFASGENPANGVVQLRMNNVSTEGAIDWSEIRRVPANGRKTERYALAPGDVVFNSTNSPDLVGKTALFSGFKEPVVFSNHFLRIRIEREAADPGYVARWLSFQWKRRTFENLCIRWVNQASVRKEDLLDLQMSLPELSEQQRIARQLDQADQLRRTRRYSLELTDSFVPAAFLEFFGDPVRNARGWSVHELAELATVERGKFTPRPRNDPSYYGGRFPFIQTGDISASEGRLRSWTQTLNERGVKVSRCFPPGTVVIAIVGATIGMTAILEIDVYCPDSVVGIQVNPKTATKEYIEFLLRFWRPVFLAQAPETARANINLDTLRPLRIPVPPLCLQQKFAAVVKQVECLRMIQREVLRQAEHLFASLLDRAFSA
jgi:restriction endonuclease S subunit